MNEKPSFLKAGAIGLIAGIIGSILGAIPFGIVHYFLTDILVNKIFGSYAATPMTLLILAGGLPLPILAVICLPIGGAIFGLAGAFIGLQRNSSKLWLWGGLAGVLFNLFVSFMSQ
jgi:hypothetical protein